MHGHYVAIGPYDFINMLESPNNKTIARVFLELGSRGTVHITSLPTIPVDEFITRARK